MGYYIETNLSKVIYDGGKLDISNNNLSSLKGCPRKVNGDFDCSKNHLTTLVGCPEVVKRNFNCAENELTSLEGCPKSLKGKFDCSFNLYLKDISNLPEDVVDLYIRECRYIEVFPKHITNTLRVHGVCNNVYDRIKQQPHLEIIENIHFDAIVIREKSLGNQLLAAI